MWTGNEKLDKLRSKAAAEPSGVIKVSIEELNKILPVKNSIPLDEPVKPATAESVRVNNKNGFRNTKNERRRQ